MMTCADRRKPVPAELPKPVRRQIEVIVLYLRSTVFTSESATDVALSYLEEAEALALTLDLGEHTIRFARAMVSARAALLTYNAPMALDILRALQDRVIERASHTTPKSAAPPNRSDT